MLEMVQTLRQEISDRKVHHEIRKMVHADSFRHSLNGRIHPSAYRPRGTAEWFYRGLVLLVISCPCALVISIPLGYFGGIGSASKKGILVKGANVFDALAKVTTAIFDKTGTLTYGRFKVTKIVPSEGTSEEELLKTAASAETGSTHPLAEAVREAAGEIELSPEAILTQVPGKGMVLTLGCSVTAVGNTALMKDFGITPEEVPTQGTVMHVIKDGTYMGL